MPPPPDLSLESLRFLSSSGLSIAPHPGETHPVRTGRPCRPGGLEPVVAPDEGTGPRPGRDFGDTSGVET